MPYTIPAVRTAPSSPYHGYKDSPHIIEVFTERFTMTSKLLTSKDGAEIYAESAGHPSKPHVLFGHDLAVDADAFDPIFTDETYRAQLYMVRFDMRGHGRSGKPTTLEAYSSKHQAEDVEVVMKAFGLKNFFQVGWSLGGTLAADVLSHISSNPLAGVIWLAPLPYLGPVVQAVSTPGILAFLPGLSNTDAALAFSARIASVNYWVADIAKVPFQIRNQWIGSSIRQSPELAGFLFGREQDPKALSEAGMKGLPSLVIYGTEGKVVDGEGVVEAPRPDFPQLKVKVLKGVVHSPVYEAAKETGDAIVEFITSLV